jgi:hypothetical protein
VRNAWIDAAAPVGRFIPKCEKVWPNRSNFHRCVAFRTTSLLSSVFFAILFNRFDPSIGVLRTHRKQLEDPPFPRCVLGSRCKLSIFLLMLYDLALAAPHTSRWQQPKCSSSNSSLRLSRCSAALLRIYCLLPSVAGSPVRDPSMALKAAGFLLVALLGCASAAHSTHGRPRALLQDEEDSILGSSTLFSSLDASPAPTDELTDASPAPAALDTSPASDTSLSASPTPAAAEEEDAGVTDPSLPGAGIPGCPPYLDLGKYRTTDFTDTLNTTESISPLRPSADVPAGEWIQVGVHCCCAGAAPTACVLTYVVHAARALLKQWCLKIPCQKPSGGQDWCGLLLHSVCLPTRLAQRLVCLMLVRGLLNLQGRATFYGTDERIEAQRTACGEQAGQFGILAQGACGYTNSDGSLPFPRVVYAAAADTNEDYPGSCGRCYQVSASWCTCVCVVPRAALLPAPASAKSGMPQPKGSVLLIFLA